MDEGDGTEGVSYLADQYAATPTSSTSFGEENGDLDELVDDNEDDAIQSPPADIHSGAEFPWNSDAGQDFRGDFQFADTITDQLREILAKPVLPDSADEMNENGIDDQISNGEGSRCTSSGRKQKQPSSGKRGESLGMRTLAVDGKRQLDCSAASDEGNTLTAITHVQQNSSTPSVSERGLDRGPEMHLPLSGHSSPEAQSSVSPTGKAASYLPHSQSFGSTTSDSPFQSKQMSVGKHKMLCRKSPVPLSRPVSVEAGLAAMSLQQQMSPVYRHQSVPLYHSRGGSQSTLWDQEKDELENQLELSRDTIASLQAENKTMKTKFSKMPGIVQQLKDQLSKCQSELDREKQQHSLEASQLQRKARLEREKQKREAEQELREVQRERDSLKGEVMALNKSIDALKKDSSRSKLSVEDSLQGQRKSTQAEIAALKDELRAVKDVLEESENSRLNEQRKHQGTSQDLAKLQKLAVRLKQQLEDAQRRKVIEYNGERMEVGELQARLANAEQQLVDLHDSRAADITAAEARLREENIRLRVDFGEAVCTAEKEKEKLQASIVQHEKQISKLTIDLTHAQDGPRPSGEKGKKQMQYYGRWTAHRAESRKHAEEMKIITTALEKEGYAPNQATVDEVIRYLWWKKERNDVELSETKETLAALGGEEPQRAFKAWKEENETLVAQVHALKDELETVTRNSRITEETLRKEVENLGLDNQHVREDLHAAQGQTALAQEETHVAKKELGEIRKRITQQAAEIGELKGLQEKSRTELEQLRAAVQQEKRHSAVLRSEAVSLRGQLDSKTKQMKQLHASETGIKGTLADATLTKEQLQKRIRELEEEVSALQSDGNVAKQHNESLRKECDDVCQQLDEAYAKLTLKEAQLTRELHEKEQLRHDVEEVEKDLSERLRDLEHSNLNQSELQDEVNDLSAELQEVHDRVSLIENDNIRLQSEVKSSVEAAQLTSTDKDNLSIDLASSKKDLDEMRRTVASLQQQLKAGEREIEQLQRTIAASERHKDELVKMLDQAKIELQLSQKKTEDVKAEEQQVRTYLATKEQELQSAEVLIGSLKADMTEVRGELHTTRDRKDGAEKEMVAVKGTVKQQSEHIEQLMKQVEVTAAELNATHTELSTERKTVSHLKTECGKHETRIEVLTQELAKESQRADQLFADLKMAQEQHSREGEKTGSKMRVLEGDKGKLQGEIKAITHSLSTLQIEHEELQRTVTREKEEWMHARADSQAEIKELKVQLHTERVAKQEMAGQLANRHEQIESLTAEVGTVREQMLRERQSEERELRRVLERLQSESLKQQTKHEEQIMQASQAERQAVDRERSLRSELETSETQKSTLQSQIETLKRQNRAEHENIKALERRLQELHEELGQARDENTTQMQEFAKLRESHDDELRQLMEQRTQTVGELSAAHEVSRYLSKENDTLQAQVQQLKSQLSEEMERVEKVKELYREEVRSLTEKMERSTLSLSTAHQESKQVEHSYEKKLSESEARVTSLEAELGRQAMELRMVETENASLKSRLDRTSQDLEASINACGNFEKTAEVEKETWRREYATVRDELQCQKEKMVMVMAQLTEAKANVQALDEDNKSLHSTLEYERQAVLNVQLQLDHVIEEKSVATRQLQLLSEEKVSMSSEIAQTKQIMQEERAQSATLRQHLQEAITQVQEKHEVSLQAQSKFNSLLGSLQTEFERDRHALELERDNLKREVSAETAELESLQEQVRQTENKLAASNAEMAEAAQKTAECLESLDKEITLRTEFQQQASELGRQLTRCKLEINTLSESVTVTKAVNLELQLKLDRAERQAHSLADQLNEEKAVATVSQTTMGEQHRHLTTKLEDELTHVNSQLAQARAQLSLTKEELVSTSQARDSLSNTVDELNKVVEQLRSDLRSEMTQRKLAKQQADHFEKMLSEKKTEKAFHMDEIQKLQATLADTQAALGLCRKRLEQADHKREDLDGCLKVQQSRTDLVQQKLERAENELRDAHRQLNEQTLQYSNSTKRISRELATTRDQHIEDCKQMKDEVENTSQQLKKLRREIADVESEKALLEAERQQMLDEKSVLHARQEQLKESLRNVTDTKDKLELKNEELLAQVSHMKDEIAALHKSEEDMIEYQRSLESSTRTDMHRLVAEITQQLDQQYSARESVHRLQAENEKSALHSAKQKIDELQMERRQLQTQCAREQKQCEAMKTELSSVYSQRLHEDRMRKKLESRLEKVNEALNRSKAVAAVGMSPTQVSPSPRPLLNDRRH